MPFPLYRPLSLLALLALGACASLPPAQPARLPPSPQAPAVARPVPAPQPIQLQLAPPAPPSKRFNVSVHDIPASQFFLALIAGSGRNLVAPPNLEARITLNLQNVTLEESLAAVRDAYGYDYERTAYGYRVLPQALQTRVFTVDYLSIERSGVSKSRVNGADMQARMGSGAQGGGGGGSSGEEGAGIRIETRTSSRFWAELEASLKQIVGSKDARGVSLNPQAGVVVVTASAGELEAVGRYLSALQSSLSRQVVLEAKILEVSLSDGFQSGINWAALAEPGRRSVSLGQTGGAGLVTGGAVPNAGATGNLNPLAAVFPDFSRIAGFGGAFSAALQLGDFTAFIELLESQGEVRVLSSPRIATLNNQKAVIKVGSDEFFVTDIASTTVSSGAGVTSSPTVSLTPFFSGIALDVTPQISEGGAVTLHVHPTVSEVREQLKLLPLGETSREVPLAASTIREADSVIRAQSGQMVVIGGLMQSSSDDRDAGIPVLKDLPGVGSLFRQTKRSGSKKELVILLRPIVVDDAAAAAEGEASRQHFARVLEGGVP